MKAYKELFLNGLLVANDTAAPVLYVAHGATAGTARPTGALAVIWYGTVTPTNMTSADLYVNTTTRDISTSSGTNSATGGGAVTYGYAASTAAQGNDPRLGIASVDNVATASLTLSGLQNIDGVTGVSGTVTLCSGQGFASVNNGPWVQAAGAWTRPLWFATGSTALQQMAFVAGNNGTLYNNTQWNLLMITPFTVGTSGCFVVPMRSHFIPYWAAARWGTD